MESFFASGRVIDVILAVMAIEAVLLIVHRLRSGSGPTVGQTIANMSSGAMIMLAVKSALTDASWTITAAFLLGSFLAHIVDLTLRLRERRGPAVTTRL